MSVPELNQHEEPSTVSLRPAALKTIPVTARTKADLQGVLFPERKGRGYEEPLGCHAKALQTKPHSREKNYGPLNYASPRK